MEAIKIYILEDEIVTQMLLKKHLEDFGYVVCGSSRTAQTALREIELLKPDFALLDINVKGDETGIWLGDQLTIPFIYITAYGDPDTIKSAIKTDPIGYLIKPFNEMEVFAIIEMTMSHLKSEQYDKNKKDEQKAVIIKDGKSHVKVDVNDIFYIKSEGKYIEIYLKNKRIVIRESLVGFLDDTKSPFIIRVHGSYLINIKMVESFDACFAYIKDVHIPVSRRFKKPFVEKMTTLKI